MMLFDGSYLGYYDFSDVVLSVRPLPGIKFLIHAKLLTEDGIEDVLMYKFDANGNYAISMDKIKPLFGIKKTGTHIIRLSHSPRKIMAKKAWNCPVDKYSSNVYFVPIKQRYLIYKYGVQSTSILTPEFDGELQKYILFQEAVHNKNITLKNFWISQEGFIQSHELCFSDEEVHAGSTCKEVYSHIDKAQALRDMKSTIDFNLRRDLHACIHDQYLHIVELIFEVLNL